MNSPLGDHIFLHDCSVKLAHHQNHRLFFIHKESARVSVHWVVKRLIEDVFTHLKLDFFCAQASLTRLQRKAAAQGGHAGRTRVSELSKRAHASTASGLRLSDSKNGELK